ncbi:peptidoglycan recognition protein-like [Aricia agestis]|uniref:peptidoglycan recognition protein-like n=1 Tax=Aricia agestis TaxID=91739 RepID=UPI001C2038B2|nr:peptidoglycan recognition protein-like [Aricia agestis]
MKCMFCVFLVIFAFCRYVYAECPVIVSKDEWDGLTPSHVEYLKRPVDLVIIQHTVTGTCNTDDACERIARSIQTYQMDQLNYWDLGMNFLIGGNGKVYEGSGWLHVGAHTYGYNRDSIGISFIGNFNDDTPTVKMLEAAQNLLQCGVDGGHLSPKYRLVGHKQLIATESPGQKLYREIRRWPNFLADVSSIKKN